MSDLSNRDPFSAFVKSMAAMTKTAVDALDALAPSPPETRWQRLLCRLRLRKPRPRRQGWRPSEAQLQRQADELRRWVEEMRQMLAKRERYGA